MLKKYQAILSGVQRYEDSNATIHIFNAINGATLWVWGVPSVSQGGPKKGELVDLAVIETADEDGNVTRNFAKAVLVPGGVNMKSVETGDAAPTIRPAFNKEGYTRKRAISEYADDAMAAPPPVVTAPPAPALQPA